MLQSSNQVLLLINISDMRNLGGLVKKFAKDKEINVITPINKESIPLVKKWMRFANVRYYEISTQEKIAITKDSVLIFELSSPLALYSNDPKFVSMFNKFIESEWNIAPRAEEKIREIETGKPVEEIVFMRGRENLFKLLPDFYRDAKTDIIVMTSKNGIMRTYKYLNKYLNEARSRGVRLRIITTITKENIEIAKNICAEVRHIDKVHAVAGCYDNSSLTMLDIKNDNISKNSPDDTILMINNSDTVEMMRQMLESVWENATSLEERISDLEGKPRNEMKVISGTENIYKIFREIISQAKKEICIISSEDTLERAIKYGTFELDKKMSKHVKVRYMIPITQKNLHLVKKAMEFAEIRHIDFTPIRSRMIDGEKCTMRYGAEDIASARELCLFSNIESYVANVKEYYEWLWKKAIPAEEKISELEEELNSRGKNEVSIIVDSIEHLKKYPIEKLHSSGVKINVLMPINGEETEYLKKISRFAQIRHVPEVFLLSIQAGKREGLFQNLWNSALSLEERIAEIES